MLQDFFPELIRGGGDQNSQQNSCIWRKISIEVFWIILKLCSSFDFEFTEKFYMTFL